MSRISRFYLDTAEPSSFRITGTTLDVAGAPLAGCAVDAFDTQTDVKLVSTVSDANGKFTLDVTGGRTFYLVAYLASSPDVAGTTINTLVGT